MSQGGKLLRLADHPRFGNIQRDPEPIDPNDPFHHEPTEEELDRHAYGSAPEFADEEYGLAVCNQCVHAEDRRSLLRQVLGHPADPSDMSCSQKGDRRCSVVNPRNDCTDFEIHLVE